MKRKGCVWLAVGAAATAVLAHVLLATLPNRDDSAANAIQEAGGKVRRTPRLLWLSVMADAPDDFYPRGDVWNVELRDAEVGAVVAGHLTTLQSLENLHLSRCRLPPGMTANLVPTSGSLRSLSVYDTNLGDPHITRLGDCPNLVYLILDGTDVTDASVPVIAQCRSLSYIVLRKTRITEAGIVALRAAKPTANIVTEEAGGDGHRPNGP